MNYILRKLNNEYPSIESVKNAFQDFEQNINKIETNIIIKIIIII